ncbi:MAG TPA: DUF5916 domain-containing protein [Vicinamibacterales bacterium]
MQVTDDTIRRHAVQRAHGRVGVLIAMAILPPPLAAQDSPSRAAPTVRAVRGTIRVDGRLDDLLYGTTGAIESFVQQEPDEGKPATERTEAWVFFDDDMIYVAARCWESRRERRVANEMRRDTNQLRQNDTFAVLFDTFHDRRNGYLFTANAIGGMGDSQITDEGPPNVDWNTVWTFETAEFDEGWTVEMAIPFKSLRYQSGREQTWGINLRRVVRWKNEWSYFAQVPRALTTFRGILKVSSAGMLVGLQAPSGTHMIELKPYALSGVASDTTVTPPLSNDVTKRIGGDLKYGVTQNLTADVTINTDFAQVEVDEQQVNLTPASTRRSRSIRTCASIRTWPARRRTADVATISVTAASSTTTPIATGSRRSDWWSSPTSFPRSGSCDEPICGATSCRRASARDRRGYRTCANSPRRRASTI